MTTTKHFSGLKCGGCCRVSAGCSLVILMGVLLGGCSRLNEPAGAPQVFNAPPTGARQEAPPAQTQPTPRHENQPQPQYDNQRPDWEYGSRQVEQVQAHDVAYEGSEQDYQARGDYQGQYTPRQDGRYQPNEPEVAAVNSDEYQRGYERGYRDRQSQRGQPPEQVQPYWEDAAGTGPTPQYHRSPGNRDDYANGSERLTPRETWRPTVTGVTITEVEPSGDDGAPGMIDRRTVTVTMPPATDEKVGANTMRTVPALKLREDSHLGDVRLAQRTVTPPSSVKPAGIAPAISELEELLSREPGNVPAQMALRCLYLANGQQDKAMDSKLLAGLSPEQQKEAHAMMQAMLLTARSHYGRDKDNPDIDNRALEAVGELMDQVADNAELMITALAVCRTVHDFGRYEAVSAEELSDGKAKSAIVYCELRNFKSEKDEQGKYLSRLRAEFTLYDSTWRVRAHRASEVTDVPSFTRRHDFYLRGEFALPRLEPGKYQLEVRITDTIAGKIARPKRLDFEVKPALRSE